MSIDSPFKILQLSDSNSDEAFIRKCEKTEWTRNPVQRHKLKVYDEFVTKQSVVGNLTLKIFCRAFQELSIGIKTDSIPL